MEFKYISLYLERVKEYEDLIDYRWRKYDLE